MKKILTIAVATTIAFSLCACGEKKVDNENEVKVDSLYSETDSKAIYSSLSGQYQDSTSGRASMTIAYDGTSDFATTEIEWADSAFESVQWKMSLRRTEDGLISYNDATKSSIKYDDDGNTEVSILSTDGKGYFELVDGKLLWTGAEEENAKECVFEKLPEV